MYSQLSSLSRHRRVHKREIDEETKKEVKRRRVMLAISGRRKSVIEEADREVTREDDATTIETIKEDSVTS